MTQTSYPWGGTTVGDGALAPYTDDEWSDIWRKVRTTDRTTQGVLPDYASELAVSNPAGTTIRVASGAAIVDGKFYENDTNADFSVTAPVSGTNYYRVVLRKSWSAQTVRLALIGPNTVGAPALTQTDGTTWEIALATVSITSTNTVTVTDTRTYVVHNSKKPLSLLSQPVVPITARVGGSASDWNEPGTTVYTVTPGTVKHFIGTGSIVIPSGDTAAETTVSFPSSFTDGPIVRAGVNEGVIGPNQRGPYAHAYTLELSETTEMIVHVSRASDASTVGSDTVEFWWEAIGPG